MSEEMEFEHERVGAVDGWRVPIDDWVRGERAIPSVSRARSLQSRVSSVLAGALTILLGVGALTWYYANAFTRPTRARDSAQAAAARRAQGEMPLPSLGRIDAPPPAAVPDTAVPVGAVAVAPLGAALPPVGAISVLPPRASFAKPVSHAGSSGGSSGTSSTAAPDQRLAGPVFVRQSADVSSGARQLDDASVTSHTSDEHGLGDLLRPTPVVAVQARVLPTRRFLLPKGSFVDCTLETAIDSTLPGMTTCVVATDTFSADGSVVLLERGTRLVGETRGQVQQGTARIFVLWTEARTPTGVVVPLDSPGTDELGRSGLSGTVDRHFWERFGSAILITAIDGAVQAAVQPSAGSGGTVIYNPSASQEVLTEVLKGTLNIPPTVRKSQGDRIEILVARDVDFRSVYELRR
jgi:type IV secretion system protein VirB10